MLLREVPDFFFDAHDGALPVLGELMQHAKMFQQTEVTGGNLLRRVATVEFAKQSTESFQAHGVRVAVEKTFAPTELSHEPYAHEASFYAMRFDSVLGFKRGDFPRVVHHSREPLLRITDEKQFAEPLLLLVQQRARIDVQ